MRVAIDPHLDRSLDELQEMAGISDADMAMIALRLRGAYAAFGTTPSAQLQRRIRWTFILLGAAITLLMFSLIEVQYAQRAGDTGWSTYTDTIISALPVLAAWVSAASYGAPPRRARTKTTGRYERKIRRDVPNCVDWAMLGILDRVVPELYGFHGSHHRGYRRRAEPAMQQAYLAARCAGRASAVVPVPGRDAAVRGEAHRLAHVLLAHRRAVACMLGPADLARICASLATGMIAWSRGDSAALLEYAPQSPPRVTRGRVFDFAQRVLWTAAAVGAAVVLPHFVPAARAYTGYLWLAAVGIMLAGTSVAAGSIAAVQGSLLPRRTSS